MSKSTVAELGTLASVKRKGVISSIHWEGLFFLVIALLLGFQERFLATDASVVSSNYHFLNLYFKFTSALLSSHKFLAIPFLVFFFTRPLEVRRVVCLEEYAISSASITFCG